MTRRRTPHLRCSQTPAAKIAASARRSRAARAILSWLLLAVAAGGLVAARAGERTVREWPFNQPGDLEGWRANGDLASVAISDGALHCRAIGSDPILELTAPLDFPASPWQFLEVRLRATADGTAEWFWSNTGEGRYGGFSQAKTTRFQVRGDGEWHTWRVFPFWHRESRIVRLRFDLYDGAQFGLDSLRVGELDSPPATAAADFTFTNTTQDWRAVGSAKLASQPDGLAMNLEDSEAFLLAPPVRLRAEEQSFLSLQMAVDRGRYATLIFATDSAPGLHRFAFPLVTNGAAFTYNLDLLAAKDWQGQVIAVGLQPSDAPGATARLAWLKIDATPHGPPQLKVKSFAPDAAPLRVGRPATIEAVIANVGATPITNLAASLVLPAGLRLASGSTTQASAGRLSFDEETSFRWTVSADAPGEFVVSLNLSSANTPKLQSERRLAFTPDLHLAKADYVPEPKPVRGPFEVGAYYFPGWRSAGQWQPLCSFPERRPLLGWYREGDPEVADWHIKWAVEHGITFFAYDWYWSQGARQLEHALHDGYFHARYRHLLKFCLLWANHNPPGTHSQADCLAVTRYWIENYFRRPEHLTVAGKPVVIIFSPQRFTEDLGSAGVKTAFEAMRAECRAAGLPGLYLLACVGDAGQARTASAEGYDAITAYNWAGLGMTGASLFAPFATLPDGYRRQWEQLRAQSPIPMMLPVSGGWDSRPWHGENNLVRYGRTPALFRQHLAAAKQFLAGQSDASAVRNFVLIEAWNEWGEGSYIEPHQEFGFGYLDAIRDVITDAPRDHLDIVPADVGLGPYDVPPEPPGRTAWSFGDGDAGWGSGMNLAELRATNGVLSARTIGNDPAFLGPPIKVRADPFRAIDLRMRLTPTDGRAFADSAQLFWGTAHLPESEATSLRFPVRADGEWHEHRLPVSDNLRWRGVVTRLRLDPCSRAGVEVGLDYLRLMP